MKQMAMVLIAVVGILWSSGVWAAAGPKSQARAVRGEVVAVNLTDSPQVIVITAKVGKKQEEMVVGATVESGAEILRGKDRITLGDIKVGQTVELTYVKDEKGLTARSIRVK